MTAQYQASDWPRKMLAWIIFAGFILPILIGLGVALLLSVGLLGTTEAGISLSSWAQMVSADGLGKSVLLTLWTGIASTTISLFLAMGIMARLYGRGSRLRLWLAPILATPHAAMAIGVAFLIAPSGWIARSVDNLLNLGGVPPQIASVNDPFGLALILGLVIKELPFILLLSYSALAQIPVDRHLRVGRSLGYDHATAWSRLVLPQLYRLIRLPIVIVLAFSLSVVDMALVLGPNTPPTLAVVILRSFNAPDIGLIHASNAAAIFMGVLTALAIGGWFMGARLIGAFRVRSFRKGARCTWFGTWAILAQYVTVLMIILGVLGIIVLAVWSFTWRWPFPMIWPESGSLKNWLSPRSGLWEIAGVTLMIGVIAMSVSVALSLLWLEVQGNAGHWLSALIYLPLILPQIVYLYGWNVGLLRLGVPNGMAATIWVHCLFVFPYVLIILSEGWRRIDPKLIKAATALGASRGRRFWRVKLPLVLPSVLAAAAVGFSVSVALYLPTLFMGAGRVVTLTTEAVTLSSGADRRIAAVFAFLQAVLPYIGFALAMIIPSIVRAKKGLKA